MASVIKGLATFLIEGSNVQVGSVSVINIIGVEASSRARRSVVRRCGKHLNVCGVRAPRDKYTDWRYCM